MLLQDDEHIDFDYKGNEDATLKSYTTPLDKENCNVDEYVVFKEVLQSEY